jgi:plastocyanin
MGRIVMKNRVRWVLLCLLVVSVSLAVYACSSKDKKNPMTGGGGGLGTPDVLITITGISGSSSFSPNPANVTVGQTIAWKNNAAGMAQHRPIQDGGSPTFNGGFIDYGATCDTIRINTAGDFSYHCSIHPSMVGTLHVTP